MLTISMHDLDLAMKTLKRKLFYPCYFITGNYWTEVKALML